jgi:hypothetical protein
MKTLIITETYIRAFENGFNNREFRAYWQVSAVNVIYLRVLFSVRGVKYETEEMELSQFS